MMIISNGWKFRRNFSDKFHFFCSFKRDCFCPCYITLFGRGIVPFGWKFDRSALEYNAVAFKITLLNFDFDFLKKPKL